MSKKEADERDKLLFTRSLKVKIGNYLPKLDGKKRWIKLKKLKNPVATCATGTVGRWIRFKMNSEW